MQPHRLWGKHDFTIMYSTPSSRPGWGATAPVPLPATGAGSQTSSWAGIEVRGGGLCPRLLPHTSLCELWRHTQPWYSILGGRERTSLPHAVAPSGYQQVWKPNPTFLSIQLITVIRFNTHFVLSGLIWCTVRLRD